MYQDHYPDENIEPETLGSRSGGLVINRTFIPIVVILLSICLILCVSQVTIVTKDETPKAEDNKIAALFTPEVRYWSYKIIPWSKQFGLDPNLVATVLQIESCGHPKATSSAGAMGLFQVMPFHFNTDDDPYKPNINARRGLAYLRQAFDSGNGDIRLAFAGYNGGIYGATRPEASWPAETLRYVYWGVGIYSDAAQNKSHSSRLEEWLAAGGSSLCDAASSNLGIKY